MKTVKDISPLRDAIDDQKRRAARVAFVPTMGNLHDGHISLVRQALADNDAVVVSIFVNPFQFGANEDFDTYPRTLSSDLDRLREVGADIVFLPDVSVIYPRGSENCTQVQVRSLDSVYCGASRPGFFVGVCTVVNILFNLVRPDVAYFGQKDYQQLLVIRRMVDDLRMSIEVRAGETVREHDGLAMSSRNAYLSPAERRLAPHLHAKIAWIQSQIEAGNVDFQALETEALVALTDLGFRPDYVAVANAQDLSPPTVGDGFVVLAAAWLGQTRLIDNVLTNGR